MDVPELTMEERQEIASADDWLEGFLRAWKIIVRKTGREWDDMEVIDPQDFAVTRDDWVWMCETLQQLEATNDGRVSVAMEWVNRGPSVQDDRRLR